MFIINKNKLKIEYLMIYNFLFPTKPNTTKTSLLLLAVRIIFGVLLMNHGIQKWSNFQELSAVFPDPTGIRQPHFSRVSHFRRIGMLNGIYRRLFISFGNDSDGFHNDSGIFYRSCQ